MLYNTIHGEKVSELRHSLDTVKKHPGARIYVGTDSQNKKRHTNYVVVIAYRYGRKGAHFIYSKTRVRKIKDRWTRLQKEVDMSVEVANRLRDAGVDIYSIDLDVNKDVQAGSNFIHGYAVGYCTGAGYRVTTKPDEQVACKAADHLVR